jgi:hypothetical protein
MAREITIYEAHDGTRFDTLERATQHEQLIAVVADAMAPLPDPPDGEFGNERRGYWPHDPDAVTAAKVRLVELAAALNVGQGWFKEHLHEAADIHPSSYAGRVMSECGPAPLDRAWRRLSRIDDRGREWEQPYFALNPSKGCQHPYGQEPAEEPA